MESDSPANKNLQPDGTAASPTPIRLNTPDPHEATQPLRITMVQDVVPQEKTASEPAKELEETRPILVRQPSVGGATPESPSVHPQAEELPAWLISFARQETPSEQTVNPGDDTREITLEHPQTSIDNEGKTFEPIVPTEEAAATDSGWTLESNPDTTAPLSDLDEAEEKPDPALLQAEPSTAEISRDDLSTTNISEPQEVADPEIRSEPVLGKLLDEGNIAEAAAMIEEIEKNPEARAEGLRVLRSRLDTNPENQPLWEFFARLSAADNQPLLAQKALETAEKLKNTFGE